MKINELIKAVTKEYMPMKKQIIEAEKNKTVLPKEVTQKYLELETTLNFYKIIKGIFVEEFTKNEALVEYLVGEKKLTLRKEQVKDKDGKEITVSIVNEPMDVRVDMMPEQFYRPLFEEMVKGHKKNINEFKNRMDWIGLEKEEIELKILESYLPKEATTEDIEAWLSNNYPAGFDMKQMGPIIGQAKKAFERADGKMISEVVRKYANK